jgi:hypothetical protein
MIEISRDFDGCSGTRKEELFDAGENQIYQPGRIESKSSRNSSSQTITIRISEP